MSERVTDEMVEAAVAAFWAADRYEHTGEETRQAMREALAAALETTTSRLEAAEKERDDYKLAAAAEAQLVDEAHTMLKEQGAELQASTSRLRVLEEALRPFADEAGFWDEAEPKPDSDAVPSMVEATIADLRRARSALEGET